MGSFPCLGQELCDLCGTGFGFFIWKVPIIGRAGPKHIGIKLKEDVLNPVLPSMQQSPLRAS